MLLVLAFAGIYLERLVDDQLIAYFDSTLNAKARSIVALTEQDEDGIELEVYDVALPLFSRENDPDYFYMVDSSGDTLFASASARGFIDALPEIVAVSAIDRIEIYESPHGFAPYLQYFDHELPDGRSGRWLAVSYFPKIDPDDDELGVVYSTSQDLENTLSTEFVLNSEGLVSVNGELISPERVLTFVGTSRSDLNQLLWSIDIILLLSGIAVAGAIVLIAGVGIRRAIAPLAQLSTDIAALDSRSLDSRITLKKPIAELDVVVDQFNLLLERLTTAFSQERQFSADVAHELRTPIAEMRSLIEVQARFPKNSEINTTYSQDLLGSTMRMQHIVENLMMLSKAEHETIDIGESLDIVAVLKILVDRYHVKAAARGMDIVFTSEHSLLMVSGSHVWPMILSNVLDNAIDHATGAGSIICELNASKDRYSLSVSNPCNDLVEEDVASVTHRLWRKDSARSDSSHSGLGLALVAAYAGFLEVEVVPSLYTAPDTGSESRRFRIVFNGSHV